MKSLHSSIAPLIVVLLVAFASHAHAQFWKNMMGEKGNGNVVSETRNVSSFDKISATSGIDVIFETGSQSVEVTTDENLLEYIVTEVKNSELIIKRKNKINIKKATKQEVRVSAPTLVAVSSSSGADFTAKGVIKSSTMDISSSSGADLQMSVDAKKLSVNSSSGADLQLNIQSDDIEAKASSGADMELKGSARTAKLSASSGAEVNAYQLTVDTCDAKASSAGGISITVKNELNAKASSGGDVSYKGSPKTTNVTKSSGGDVSARK